MKKNLAKKSKKGFTLIELVVVIAILGILAAILIPVIGGFIQRANTAKDQANARNLYNSAAMALATGTPVATITGATATAFPTALSDLFGPLPTDCTNITITVANNSVATARYNNVTYSRTSGFSGS